MFTDGDDGGATSGPSEAIRSHRVGENSPLDSVAVLKQGLEVIEATQQVIPL